MSNPGRAWRLWFAILAFAGVVIVASALIASAGDLLAGISVRGSGDGTVPAIIVVTVGAMLAPVGAAAFVWRRD